MTNRELFESPEMVPHPVAMAENIGPRIRSQLTMVFGSIEDWELAGSLDLLWLEPGTLEVQFTLVETE